MIVISAGFMKSASTLIHDYQVDMIELASKRSGQKQLEKFSSGRGAAYRGKLDLKTFLILIVINFLYGDVALKTHSGPTFFVRVLVALGLAKVTYSYRDPRDVALSMRDHGIRTRKKGEIFKDHRGFSDVHKVADALPKVKEEIENWYGWRDFGNVLLIRYEEFMTQKAKCLQEIAQHLNYDLSQGDLQTLLDKYTDLKSRNFNKGTVERYKEELSATDLATCNKALARELKDMSYSV